ncbi:MAG: lamin tail domain-containing protein, partial [Patescibacteria group bacterium]
MTLFSYQEVFSQTPIVVINEIMYDPAGDDYYTEWVELKNVSSGLVDLSGWTFCGQELLGGYVDHNAGGELKESESTILAAGNLALITDGGSGTDVYTVNSVSTNVLAFHVDSSSLCDSGLSNSGEEVSLVTSGNESTVSYLKDWGGGGNGKTVGLINGSWKENEPTPGVENRSVQIQEELTVNTPKISFSTTSSAIVDTGFSLNVTFSNFSPQNYYLKVLIGQGDNFYDGRTKGTSGEWLAWNSSWDGFPKITVGSLGNGSKTVQAKVKEEAKAGSYKIKIKAFDGNKFFESPVKEISVSAALENSPSGNTTTDTNIKNDWSEDTNFSDLILTKSEGTVLGEHAGENDPQEFNFYLILGLFGLAVGSFGIVFAKRLADEGKELNRKDVGKVAKNKR